ncbi:MAG: protein kinase [Polyangiaceae bacterium]
MSPEPTFACQPRSERTTSVAPPSAPVILEDQYELIEPIGEGGMGVVWRARDRRLDIDVAVKLVHAEPDAAVSRRLLAEARAVARVTHPSTVRIYGSGMTPLHEPYIAMELLQGESLEDHLDRRGRLPAVEAVKLILPIVGAVAAAHDRGIVHRDLKPSNIFLATGPTGRMRPKLLDFGIAKHLDASPVHATMEGAILGTPSYMSPEQARGSANVDARTDVWALATVLYELLAGQPPFVGDNYNAIMSSVLVDEPVPLVGIDQALWTIIAQALQKRREDRYATARGFGEALARWLLMRGHEHDVTAAAIRQSSFFPPGGPGPSLRAPSDSHQGITLPVIPRAPAVPSLGRSSDFPTDHPKPMARAPWSLVVAAGVMAGLSLTTLTYRVAQPHPAVAAASLAATVPITMAPEPSSPPAVGADPEPAPEPSAQASSEPTATPAASAAPPKPRARRRRAPEPAAPKPTPRPKPRGVGKHGMPLPSKAKF